MNSQIDVALVAMPFWPIHSPSLGIGLFHSSISQLGYKCKSLYFTFEFAKLIGPKFYDEISNAEPYRWDLAGEWIFNGQLFNETSLDDEGYVREVLYGRSSRHRTGRGIKEVTEDWVTKVLNARSLTGPFLDSCTASIVSLKPKVVGLTSIFQEHVPALALAKRIREALPETFIVIGGSNCEGPMGAETSRSFQFLDAVVSGEGDFLFPDLVSRVMRGENITGLEGLLLNEKHRGANALIQSHNHMQCDSEVANPVEDMDSLPWPNYDDYFEQLEIENVDFTDVPSPQLVFETARGCWWGQKKQCTFCGLNGSNITFRSKSSNRAFEELEYLVKRFPGRRVVVTDRIMDWKYFDDFLPKLRDSNLGVNLYCEVKANLKKEDVRLLRDAGVTLIQPGIESLSTEMLRSMRKGVTGIQNVQLLKWCTEIGIEPSWYILWGFPSDNPAEYQKMVELIPSLTHLSPPERAVRIRLDRFSPHFSNADEFGFSGVKPFPAYEYVYPLSPRAVSNLAYFFTHDRHAQSETPSYIKPLIDEIATWRRDHSQAGLLYLDKTDSLIIFDLRPIAARPIYLLDAGLRHLYLSCDHINSLQNLLASTAAANIDHIIPDIEVSLEKLVEERLIIREADHYLSLAVDLTKCQLSTHVLEHLKVLLDRDLSVDSEGYFKISSTY